MNIKHLILVLLLVLRAAAYSESSINTAGDVIQLAKASHVFSPEEIIKALKLPFSSEFQRVITSSIALSNSGVSEDSFKSSILLKNFIENTPDGWERDYVRVQNAFVLQQTGDEKQAFDMMQQVLQSVDFKRLSMVNDPLLKMLQDVPAVKEYGFENYMRGTLLQSLGYMMMNRSPNLGGINYAAAQDYFSQMPNDGPRNEAMSELDFRARTRGITLHKKTPSKPVNGDKQSAVASNSTSSSSSHASSKQLVTTPRVLPTAITSIAENSNHSLWQWCFGAGVVFFLGWLWAKKR